MNFTKQNITEKKMNQLTKIIFYYTIIGIIAVTFYNTYL